MSESDWSKRDTALTVAFALGCSALLGLVLYFIGYSEGANSAEAQNYAAQYPADTDKRISECFASADFQVRACIEEAITASREAQRSEEDLQAQQSMAEWAKWLLIVTTATLFLSGAGLIALVRTLAQGNEANKIARAGISEANRAWLKLTLVPRASYEINEGAYFIRMDTIVENVGNGVASEISVFFRAFTRALEPIGKSPTFAELESRARYGVCTNQPSSPTMFPGRNQPLPVGGRTDYGCFKKGEPHFVHVIVWVEYRLPQDDPDGPKRMTEVIATLNKMLGDSVFYGNEIDGREGYEYRVTPNELGSDYDFARAPRVT